MKKYRNLDWKIRGVICSLLSIFLLWGSYWAITKMGLISDTYDYSQVNSVQGVVTAAYWTPALEPHANGLHYDGRAKIDVCLETGENVTIELGSQLPYSEGDIVTLYTEDGIDYSLSEKAVSFNHPMHFPLFLTAVGLLSLVFVIWTVSFKWKGAVISLITIVFFALSF